MINEQQYAQLLKPLNASRVAKRAQAGRNLSYLESWDVKAHLNRIFGFCNWASDVQTADLAFEEQVDSKNGGKQWSVGYKVVLRLSVAGATYTEAAVGFASLPQRGEAHDMAIKTAESDALKRAAINLGTQFGLSLYNDGSLKDVVGMTLDRNLSTVEKNETIEEVKPQPAPEPEAKDTEGAANWYEQIAAAYGSDDESKTDRMQALMDVKKQMLAEDVNNWVYNKLTLGTWMDRAVAAVAKGK